MSPEIDFERYKFDQELVMRKEELRLKEKELDLERERMATGNLQESKKTRITYYGALAAALGALGGFIGIYIQGVQNRDLEKQKFQTSLIFKAVETAKPEEASRNLLFLVRAGFIEDSDHKIEELARNPSSSPFLSLLSAARTEGGYTISAQDMREYCVKTLGPNFIARDNFCLNGKASIPIQFAKICIWRTGYPQFLYDPISATLRCRSSLTTTPSLGGQVSNE